MNRKTTIQRKGAKGKSRKERPSWRRLTSHRSHRFGERTRTAAALSTPCAAAQELGPTCGSQGGSRAANDELGSPSIPMILPSMILPFLQFRGSSRHVRVCGDGRIVEGRIICLLRGGTQFAAGGAEKPFFLSVVSGEAGSATLANRACGARFLVLVLRPRPRTAGFRFRFRGRWFSLRLRALRPLP